jgi:hypothetical protein
MIERSGDAVCELHHTEGGEERMFLGLASKSRSTVSPVWPQNRWLQFLWFGLKITRSGFSVWASKPAAAIW